MSDPTQELFDYIVERMFKKDAYPFGVLREVASDWSLDTRGLYEESGEEPPGAGEDCFENAMCLKYPLL